LNLAIQNQALGPSTQPNAHLAICMTYYDDPALAGQSFRPEVYMTDRNGVNTFAFTPANTAVVLQGTDQWHDAYFELPDVKFNGVNQGPQAAARFVASGKIFFSRVRYGVIRPCGPLAGQNPVAECDPVSLVIRYEGGNVRLSWTSSLDTWTLESTTSLSVPNWQPVPGTPQVNGNERSLIVTTGEGAFFRLSR
jgi:hypothetical protein